MNSRLTPWNATLVHYKVCVFDDDDPGFEKVRPGFAFINHVTREIYVRRADVRVLQASIKAIVAIKKIMERPNR